MFLCDSDDFKSPLLLLLVELLISFKLSFMWNKDLSESITLTEELDLFVFYSLLLSPFDVLVVVVLAEDSSLRP